MSVSKVACRPESARKQDAAACAMSFCAQRTQEEVAGMSNNTDEPSLENADVSEC